MIFKKSSLSILCSCLIAAAAAGCSSDDSNDSSEKCNYTAPKCNQDGTALLTCTDGKETSKACTCKNNLCEEAPQGCNYTAPKCNQDGTALLTCTDGKETSKACTCKNNLCEEAPQGCNYTAPKCNQDGTALLTCTDGKETSKACTCKNNQCEEAPQGCDYSEPKCNQDGTALLTCTNGKETSKTCTCKNNQCESAVQKCNAEIKSTCADNLSILKCDLTKQETFADPCPDDKVCVEGACYDPSQTSSCTEDSCTADGASIRRCTDGRIVYEPCPVRTICDDYDSAPECVSTVVDGKCTDDFIPYCDSSNAAYTCSDAGQISKEQCSNQKECRDGQCFNKMPTNKKIGDECNPDTFTHPICIDNTPADCDTKSKHVKALDTCEGAEVCGTYKDDSGILNAECFEPCTVLGELRDTCSVAADIAYRYTNECIDIGDGKKGYMTVVGTFDMCDIGCKEGKCMDYTEDIKDIGKTCNPKEFDGYCTDKSVAVTCQEDAALESDIVSAEKCDFTENCVTYMDPINQKPTADCLEKCTAGAPDKVTCEDGTGLFAGKKILYTLQCTAFDGKYAYQANTSEICKSCADGTCHK